MQNGILMFIQFHFWPALLV